MTNFLYKNLPSLGAAAAAMTLVAFLVQVNEMFGFFPY